ncbi:CpaF family protein [Bdellovibrio sp. HCB337]|uniref:CpaF family protein n=1 Tax=Bdellovibrio sp. HCB337 TaxID=3394358 RepID=UPI0039A4B4DC
MTNFADAFSKTQDKLREMSDRGYAHEDFWRTQNAEKFRQTLEGILSSESVEVQNRIRAEYFSFGPLDLLMDENDVSEILVNGPDSIWYERNGKLHPYHDRFLSESSYVNCLHRICEQAHCQSTVEVPATTGNFKDFRLTFVRQELTRNHHHVSLRRHPKNPWTLEKLQSQDWAGEKDIEFLRSLVHSRKNFLIVGNTGSGKTSLINALLNTIPSNERAIIIEDIPEIALPNPSCMKMVTREDPQGILKPVTQSDLLRHSLRLRPDRIVMGEIRGAEAKDLLMALATGHGGSFGTLHASDPRQALIRLEMLIQMGAPQWNLQAVRRLIHLSLDYILVVEKTSEGKRKFQGTYKICSLEENGFLVERLN